MGHGAEGQGAGGQGGKGQGARGQGAGGQERRRAKGNGGAKGVQRRGSKQGGRCRGAQGERTNHWEWRQGTRTCCYQGAWRCGLCGATQGARPVICRPAHVHPDKPPGKRTRQLAKQNGSGVRPQLCVGWARLAMHQKYAPRDSRPPPPLPPRPQGGKTGMGCPKEGAPVPRLPRRGARPRRLGGRQQLPRGPASQRPSAEEGQEGQSREHGRQCGAIG